MKTNTITTHIVSADEIRAAIRLWMHQIKGIVADESTIDFDTKEVYDELDWQDRYGPIGTEVTQARVIIKSKT